MSPFGFLNFKITHLKMIIERQQFNLIGKLIGIEILAICSFICLVFFFQTETDKRIFNFTILFCFSFPINTVQGFLDHSENSCIFVAEKILTYLLTAEGTDD